MMEMHNQDMSIFKKAQHDIIEKYKNDKLSRSACYLYFMQKLKPFIENYSDVINYGWNIIVKSNIPKSYVDKLLSNHYEIHSNSYYYMNALGLPWASTTYYSDGFLSKIEIYEENFIDAIQN